MREATLETLEYFKTLEEAAGHTSFSVGRERVLALRPVLTLAESEAL
jgi:hypothetical protein